MTPLIIAALMATAPTARAPEQRAALPYALCVAYTTLNDRPDVRRGGSLWMIGQVIEGTYETADDAHAAAERVSKEGLFVSRDASADEELVPPSRILRVRIDNQLPPHEPNCDEYAPRP